MIASVDSSSLIRMFRRRNLCNAVCDFDKLLPLAVCGSTRDRPFGSPDTFFPASTSWANLLDDISIVTLSHVARVRVTDTTDDEQRRSVNVNEMQDWVIWRNLAHQNLHKDLRILFG
ncbi:hypothetical protein CUC08_Gglean010749 [Alternaria sp. MG1]|nr:hypothetical protein CUC08_Gglean010749 [Alternaria sp. MG1]